MDAARQKVFVDICGSIRCREKKVVHKRGLPWGLPEVVKTVQVHCSRRRLLRREQEFHMCTINKSAPYEKSLETYLMIFVTSSLTEDMGLVNTVYIHIQTTVTLNKGRRKGKLLYKHIGNLTYTYKNILKCTYITQQMKYSHCTMYKHYIKRDTKIENILLVIFEYSDPYGLNSLLDVKELI